MKLNRGRAARFHSPKSTGISRKVRKALKRGAPAQARHLALKSRDRYRRLHPPVNPNPGDKEFNVLMPHKASIGGVYGYRTVARTAAEAKREAAEAAGLKKVPKGTKAKVMRVYNPGTGAFERCVKAVAAKGAAHSPRGVCAAQGRKKYGKAKFQEMAAAGKHKSARRNTGKRRNPAQEAAERYEYFHGRPPEHVTEVTERLHDHGTLSGIGKLIGLTILAIDGQHEVTLSKFGGALLAQNENGTQLFIRGGNQGVNLPDFGITTVHENEVLGAGLEIEYHTQKDHLRPEDGGKGNYHHKFGTHGSRLPVVLYDVRNKLLHFAGGGYTLPEVGIRG